LNSAFLMAYFFLMIRYVPPTPHAAVHKAISMTAHTGTPPLWGAGAVLSVGAEKVGAREVCMLVVSLISALTSSLTSSLVSSETVSMLSSVFSGMAIVSRSNTSPQTVQTICFSPHAASVGSTTVFQSPAVWLVMCSLILPQSAQSPS